MTTRKFNAKLDSNLMEEFKLACEQAGQSQTQAVADAIKKHLTVLKKLASVRQST